MIRASCHCGAVTLEVEPSEPLAHARRCNCSFCRRRGAATVSVPVGRLRVIHGADALTLYRWNTMTAEHWFCSICGIYTHHRRRSNPEEYGVNLGTLEGVDPSAHEAIPWSDGVNHDSDRGP